MGRGCFSVNLPSLRGRDFVTDEGHRGKNSLKTKGKGKLTGTLVASPYHCS